MSVVASIANGVDVTFAGPVVPADIDITEFALLTGSGFVVADTGGAVAANVIRMQAAGWPASTSGSNWFAGNSPATGYFVVPPSGPLIPDGTDVFGVVS